MQHEGNAAVLRMEFDPGWDGFAKTVTFWNAKGEEPVKRVLTTELLEDILTSTRVYRCPIPPEAMTEAGRLTYVIDGMQGGVRQRSVEDRLKVLPALYAPEAEDSADPTPTQAEQLQAQVEALRDELQAGIAASGAAVDSAAAAAESEKNAAASRQAAAESRQSTAASEQAAADSAVQARSYAVGGTGTRPGEDRANARYYMEQAQKMAGGEFLTEEQLEQRLEQLTAKDVGAVDAAGDTMTGELTVAGQNAAMAAKNTETARLARLQSASDLSTYLHNLQDANHRSALRLKPETAELASALMLVRVNNGSVSTYNVYHQGNKPSAADVGAAAAEHTHTAAQTGAVPVTRRVNGKPLSTDITLSAGDVGAAAYSHTHTAAQAGAVPVTRKVNGKPLSADIALSAADVGARPDTWMPNAAAVGAVPVTRAVNGKSLGGDIALTAADVGARPDTWTPTAAEVGARPVTWMPTAANVGAMTYYSSLEQLGLTLGEETIADIVSAMANHSVLLMNVNTTPDNGKNNKAAYPPPYGFEDAWGLLTVRKWSAARAEIEFMDVHSSPSRFYRKSYRSGVESGWAEEYNSLSRPTAADVGARPDTWVPGMSELGIVVSQTDITAGSAAGWQQYLVYE